MNKHKKNQILKLIHEIDSNEYGGGNVRLWNKNEMIDWNVYAQTDEWIAISKCQEWCLKSILLFS